MERGVNFQRKKGINLTVYRMQVAHCVNSTRLVLKLATLITSCLTSIFMTKGVFFELTNYAPSYMSHLLIYRKLILPEKR